MKTFRTLIVDDERYARKEMNTLLKKHPEIVIVGETSSISETVEKINLLNPDLIFLDVQLKGETGFDLFEKVKINFNTVFVTAYDNFAIRAFEVNAFDYLLKPVHPVRLSATIQRLQLGSKLISDNAEKSLKYEDCIYVPLKEGSKFIKLSNIAVISADNEYSKIKLVDGKNIIIYKSLKKWEEKLPENHFVRIHRSTVINTNYIHEIKRQPNNTQLVFIKNLSEPLEMSRRFAFKIKEINKILFE